MAKSTVNLSPELAAAEVRIKRARKVAKILSDLSAADANEILEMARRDPLADAEDAEPGDKV
jgi:hypothetical protein